MILIVAITLVLLCLNVFATRLIRRDEHSEKSQRSAQMAAAISERAARRK